MKAGESSIRRRAARALLLAFALAVALPAFALGLGRIVVKSAPGQPLLAEIPVVAADPSELGNLQVRLASPETFRRVGLPAPDAATANLRFTVAVDGRGQPVIRVTSAAPLRQPLLTFLIEVDWGSGRLVREYSALLEAPSSLAAPAQPIQAPTVATPNTIERAPEPTPPVSQPEAAPAPVVTAPAAPATALSETAAPAAPAPAPAEPAAQPAEPSPPAAATDDDAGVVSEPLPEPVPPPPAPTPEPAAEAPAPASAPEPATPEAPAPEAATPAADASTASAAMDAYTVRAGETLSGIASGLDRGARSLDQMMLALLQANPEAFIDGNINRIREGAVLRAPSDEALARYSSGEAAALVRRQVAQWRQAAAARMPAVASAVAGPEPAPVAEPAARSGGGERSAEGARLQIVPPASGKGAGTQSGAQAGGEGTMLRQEIQESRETIAARDAEVGELKTRVAELEKIQQQQQQLIAMKDGALAEARANLAKAHQQAAQAPKPTVQPAAAHDSALWPWLALALLLAAAGGWWWWRKRDPGESRARPFAIPRMPRGPLASAAAPRAEVVPAATPAPVPSFAAPAPQPDPASATPAPPATAQAARPTETPAPAAVASPGPAPAAAAEPAATPAPVEAAPAVPPPAPAASTAPVAPHWTSAPSLVGTMPPASPARALVDENASPARQVELARAYLDLGDEAAARELLREATEGRDPVAREIAARMLRELG